MPLPSPEATPPVTKMNFGCSLTTGPDSSRGLRRVRVARRQKLARARRRRRPAARLRLQLGRLAQQLLGVGDRARAASSPASMRDSSAPAARRRAPRRPRWRRCLRDPHVAVGEAGDLGQVGHDEHLPVACQTRPVARPPRARPVRRCRRRPRRRRASARRRGRRARCGTRASFGRARRPRPCSPAASERLGSAANRSCTRSAPAGPGSASGSSATSTTAPGMPSSWSFRRDRVGQRSCGRRAPPRPPRPAR